MFLLDQARFEPVKLGILAGSFNPPTLAHVALAKAALQVVDQVLFVLPRRFPHKEYVGASMDERVGMLGTVAGADDRFLAAVSDGGLFADIACEAHCMFPQAELWFVCGRDAAERIMSWNYGDACMLPRMMESFGLLVARRQGEYVPPVEYAHRIESLPFESYDEHSSTEVRERIERGEEWRRLVPPEIVEEVARIYS